MKLAQLQYYFQVDAKAHHLLAIAEQLADQISQQALLALRFENVLF
jgi:hypothetical protein